VTAVIRAVRNILRLLEIARTLSRHDALFLLEKLNVAPLVAFLGRHLARKRDVSGRPGQRLARALAEAGPSFIKLGQALATRSDLLGDEITADLAQLQDRLAPFSSAEARAAVEHEFGEPVESLFTSFDDTAVAAASIAQVHFAVTPDGREVAVKVLRPGIEAAFERDLDLFVWVAELIERTRPELHRLRPVESVQIFADSVAMEMDLRFEAAAAAELGENFEDDPILHIPDVDWARTGQRVLTTERVGGIRIDDRAALITAGHDPTAILENAALVFFKQVFRDGFFHADMHPGNLFVEADGTIAAVDFGIMGRLDRKTRLHLGEMLEGFLDRDYRRVAQAHFDAGWVPRHKSVEAFTQACRSVAEPILDKAQSEISIARLLAQLFQVTESFEMETQPQLLLLQKTMLVSEGTGRKLNPDANMWLLARPMIEQWGTEHLGPEAILRETADGVASTFQRLPLLLEGIESSTAMLAGGRVRLHPDTIRELTGSAQVGRRSNFTPVWIAGVVLAVLLALLI
jgi:ubiquinone biosynthesis protein